MENTLDIVGLVEHSHLTRFGENTDYKSKLIDKLRNKFNSDEEHLFLTSFYSYLNYNPNDFVINLDDIWKWLGFSQKIRAKELLLKEFTAGKDYISTFSGEKVGNHGGQMREDIVLSIKCFKKLCLKARTEKADQIHDYYLNLEESIHELLEEETEILRNKMSMKDTQLQDKDRMIEQTLIYNFKGKCVVYICLIIDSNGNVTVKFGRTTDIENRIKQHRKDYGNIKLKYIFETIYDREIETLIKHDSRIKPYIFTEEYNGQNRTELIRLSDTFNIEILIKIIEEIKETTNGELVNKLMKQIDDLKLKNTEILEKDIQNDIKDQRIKELTKIKVTDIIDFPIVSINILTGKEIEFQTLTKAQYHYETTLNTLRNYIDKHKQFKGTVLKSGKNKPYWYLPDNFKFSNTIKPSTQNKFIKRIEKVGGDVVYYNSITEASLYLQQEIDKKEIIGETAETTTLRKALGELLRGLPTRKPIINKYHWFKMKDIGFIIHPDGTRENIDQLDEIHINQPEPVIEEHKEEVVENTQLEGLNC